MKVKQAEKKTATTKTKQVKNEVKVKEMSVDANEKLNKKTKAKVVPQEIVEKETKVKI